MCSDTPEPRMHVPRAVPLRTSTRGAACHHSMHVKPCEASVRRSSSRRRDAMPSNAGSVAMTNSGEKMVAGCLCRTIPQRAYSIGSALPPSGAVSHMADLQFAATLIGETSGTVGLVVHFTSPGLGEPSHGARVRCSVPAHPPVM